ncbi:hypothetical protein BRD15_04970 [Halobacteriales archaeon SW_6_65_15]|nr:MAG: hypothetical protein BRD15_04970 [Halobacteriales archaeon SW_6_65_15]
MAPRWDIEHSSRIDAATPTRPPTPATVQRNRPTVLRPKRHLSADSPLASETHFAVDPEPVATDLTLAEIAANHLDFLHHEAFYRVSTDYEVTAFHVLWFGLEADSETVERSETVGHGALVEAVPEGANYLRGWFRGTKSVVGDAHDGTGPLCEANLSRDDAVEYLAERVETWAADREVILPE